MDKENYYEHIRTMFILEKITLKEYGVLSQLYPDVVTEKNIEHFVGLGKNVHRAQQFLQSMADKGLIKIGYQVESKCSLPRMSGRIPHNYTVGELHTYQ